MNATEMGRRSDSLHYDNISRRALCDKIAHLESDYEDLEAENAKLRELAKDMFDAFCVVPDEPMTYEQELLYSIEFWKRMRELGVVEGKPIELTCENMMRELGVEVKGWAL